MRRASGSIFRRYSISRSGQTRMIEVVTVDAVLTIRLAGTGDRGALSDVGAHPCLSRLRALSSRQAGAGMACAIPCRFKLHFIPSIVRISIRSIGCGAHAQKRHAQQMLRHMRPNSPMRLLRFPAVKQCPRKLGGSSVIGHRQFPIVVIRRRRSSDSDENQGISFNLTGHKAAGSGVENQIVEAIHDRHGG